MKKSLILPTLASIAALALTPFFSMIASAEDALFTINCPSEVVAGSEFSASVSCNSADEFASLSFALTYDSSCFQLKTDQESNPIWSVNTDMGDPNKDSVSIMEGGNGIIYIMMPDDVTYHYLNLNLTFDTVAVGSSDLKLIVTEINKDSDTEITHSENPVATANVIIKSQSTEPPVTTEPITTEPVSTTTEVVSTTTVSESSIVTTTSVVSSSTDSVTTTTESVKPTDPTTTTAGEDKPISNSTTTTKPAATSSANATTTKANNAGDNTTTKPASTTTTNSNGVVNTGDNFPAVALTFALSASAAVALITKRSNKD